MVEITGVEKGSPAEKAGIKKGDYLISVGIKPDRLQSQGYGESRPKTITKKLAREHPNFKEGDVLTEEYILALPEDQQAEADQINRRTEFQVLSIDYRMY